MERNHPTSSIAATTRSNFSMMRSGNHCETIAPSEIIPHGLKIWLSSIKANLHYGTVRVFRKVSFHGLFKKICIFLKNSES